MSSGRPSRNLKPVNYSKQLAGISAQASSPTSSQIGEEIKDDGDFGEVEADDDGGDDNGGDDSSEDEESEEDDDDEEEDDEDSDTAGPSKKRK